jgi:hypothetical protein
MGLWAGVLAMSTCIIVSQWREDGKGKPSPVPLELFDEQDCEK